MKIRKAEGGDMNTVSELLNELVQFEKTCNDDVNIDFTKTNKFKDDLENYFLNENYHIYLAELGKDAVGLICIKFIWESIYWDMGNKLYLDWFYIKDEHRGKGYGTELYNHVLQVSKDSGVNVIDVDMIYQNSGVQRLYKKLGFMPVAITMRKKID